MDYIQQIKFQQMCDMILGDKIPDKKHILLYADNSQAKHTIELIAANHRNNFTLITHGSSSPPDLVAPFNLAAWFAKGGGPDRALPVGIPNRVDHLPISPNTGRLCMDVDLRDYHDQLLINEIKLCVDPFCENVLNSLCTSSYILCKDLDESAWTALSMGKIPVILSKKMCETGHDLPIIYIDNIDELTGTLLKQSEAVFKNKKFNMEKLNFSYWRDKIWQTVTA